MIFFPFGALNGDVADPQAMANEFQEAHRIAQNCTQYQFVNAAFHHRDIEHGTHCKVEYASQVAQLGLTNSAGPVLTSGDVYQIPYLRGLHEVDIDTKWPNWISTYPELVFCVFSFQYARLPNSSFNNDSGDDDDPNGISVRTQIRVAIDGSILPGSGIFGTPMDGLSRGCGTNEQTVASSIHTMAILPAGSHRVVPMAGQLSAIKSAVRRVEPPAEYWDDAPDTGVVIGNRSMLVLRFARGAELGA